MNLIKKLAIKVFSFGENCALKCFFDKCVKRGKMTVSEFYEMVENDKTLQRYGYNPDGSGFIKSFYKQIIDKISDKDARRAQIVTAMYTLRHPDLVDLEITSEGGLIITPRATPEEVGKAVEVEYGIKTQIDVMTKVDMLPLSWMTDLFYKTPKLIAA